MTNNDHPRDGDLLALPTGEIGRFVAQVRAGDRQLYVCQRVAAPACERMEADAREWERVSDGSRPR